MRKLTLIIWVFAFFSFIDISMAASTYGSGFYGVGVYGIEVAEPGPSPSSGGGGLEKQAKNYDFTLDKDLIHVLVTQGDTKREKITILNTGIKPLNMEIEIQGLSKFILLNEQSFILDPGQSKTINVDIFARENEIPEIYTGRIIVKGETVTKNINAIIEVKEKRPLFDLRVDVLTKTVALDEDAKAKILILNLGELKDIDGNVVHDYKEESIRINDRLDLFRNIKVPDNILLGKYIFYAKLNYNNITATSSDSFDVVEKPALEFAYVAGLTLFNKFLIWLIVVLSLVYCLRKLRTLKLEERIVERFFMKRYKPKEKITVRVIVGNPLNVRNITIATLTILILTSIFFNISIREIPLGIVNVLTAVNLSSINPILRFIFLGLIGFLLYELLVIMNILKVSGKGEFKIKFFERIDELKPLNRDIQVLQSVASGVKPIKTENLNNAIRDFNKPTPDYRERVYQMIKDKIEGSNIGFPGYELEITGGSDNAGFPMRYDLEGSARKGIILTKGPCVRINEEGMRKKKTVVGNTIWQSTAQVNLKVIKEGKDSLAKILGKEEVKTEENKEN